MGDVGRAVGGGMGLLMGGIPGAAAGGSIGGSPEVGGVLQGIGNTLGLNGNQVNLSGLGPGAQEALFTQKLLEQYLGQGPSAAQLQMQQGLDTANANAMGMAAANRGVSPGLAARQAQQAQAQNNMQFNQQAGINRAQEQLGAAQTLGGLFGSQRQSAGQSAAIQSNANEKSADRWGGIIKGVGSAIMGMSEGGEVPGRAPVPGNSKANDVVPAKLSPGEIVIPRTHADDPAKAKEFIDQLMASKGKSKASGPQGEFDFGKLLKTQQEILKRIKALESQEEDEDEE